jgi:hypothetical protein
MHDERLVDLCEFGIVEEECFFCKQPRTVAFNEHYTFCPNCSAIYTFMMIYKDKDTCSHITGDEPTVIKKPIYKSVRDKIHIYKGGDVVPNNYHCSYCRNIVYVDGW